MPPENDTCASKMHYKDFTGDKEGFKLALVCTVTVWTELEPNERHITEKYFIHEQVTRIEDQHHLRLEYSISVLLWQDSASIMGRTPQLDRKQNPSYIISNIYILSFVLFTIWRFLDKTCMYISQWGEYYWLHVMADFYMHVKDFPECALN